MGLGSRTGAQIAGFHLLSVPDGRINRNRRNWLQLRTLSSYIGNHFRPVAGEVGAIVEQVVHGFSVITATFPEVYSRTAEALQRVSALPTGIHFLPQVATSKTTSLLLQVWGRIRKKLKVIIAGLLSGNFSTVSNTPESTPSSFVGDYSQASVGCQPSTSQRHQPGNHSFLSKSAFSMGSHPHLTRQTSDSRIHGVGSSRMVEGRHEGRHSFRWSGSSGGESSVGSTGGASDWWSMQTFSELVASSRRERLRWTSASSPSDFGWGSTRDNLDRGLLVMDRIRAGSGHAASASPRAEAQACGVCSRLLTQRSPWSSYRMVGSADCTVVGVLVCGHVYHAECLEQATPEAKRQDPPCPRCGAAEKAAHKATNSVEPVHVAKGCGSKTSNMQSQSSSRNKLSRIGVATDDISGPEFSSSHSFSEGGKSSLTTSISEKLSLGKSLSRRQFSFRNRSTKESSCGDVIPKKPGSPARVSPDSSSEDQPISTVSQPKKLRSNSFRYLKRW